MEDEPKEPPSTITVMFHAAVGAPRMRQRKFIFLSTQRWVDVVDFLRVKALRTDQPVHLFINSTYQPSPESVLEDLGRELGSQRQLSVQYALINSWG